MRHHRAEAISKAAQGSHVLLWWLLLMVVHAAPARSARAQQALPHAGMQALLIHPRYELMLSGCLL